MGIKPVDIQANLNQMHEVGRVQQARNDAIAEQQIHLDKESVEKSKLSNSKLEETKKGDSATIRDQESQKKEGNPPHKEHEASEKKKDDAKRGGWKDGPLGRFIDILK